MTGCKVQLVCQFGRAVRGLSPYCDAMLESLSSIDGVEVIPIEYSAPYPAILHPASVRNEAAAGELHWCNPLSWRRVAKSEADIIHLQHWLAPMAIYLAPLASMARKSGKRVVITVHNPNAHEKLRWTSSFERQLFRNADVLIVHDERGANALRNRLGTDQNLVHIIPHGIHVADSLPQQKTGDHVLLELDPGRRHICVFGNLRGYKGIDVLLAAWQQVVSRLPDVDLVIAGRLWSGNKSLIANLAARVLGTSQDAQRLRSMLDNNGLRGRVHLLDGFQSERHIDALLRLSVLAVFPYVRFDSQSGAASRAAGAGCPVLVSDVGGLPDLAIDENWIVNPGDVDALATIMYEKLSHPKELRVARGEQLQRVKMYEWSRVSLKYADLYCDLA